jgi:hypothetical protein
MFDISTVSKRYFGIKLTVTDNKDRTHSVELEVEPPKIGALKKLMAVGKAASKDDKSSETMDDLANAVRDMLSKNKAGYVVPMEYIDALDFDELVQILDAYFNWLGNEKSSKN